jgi:hypothetical protein
VLQALVSGRYPQVVGGDPTASRVQPQGEDMLFALLGGQVGTKAASPMNTRQLILPAVSATVSVQGDGLPSSAQSTPPISQHQQQQHQQQQQQQHVNGPMPSQLLAQNDIDPAQFRTAMTSTNFAPQQNNGHLSAPNSGNGNGNGNGDVFDYSMLFDTPTDPLAVPVVNPIPSAFALDSTPFPLHQAFYPGYINFDPNPASAIGVDLNNLGSVNGNGNGNANANVSSMGQYMGGQNQNQTPGQGQGQSDQGGQAANKGMANSNGALGIDAAFTDQMTSGDLWARLQTFYEPTPTYWGQSVVPYMGVDTGSGGQTGEGF